MSVDVILPTHSRAQTIAYSIESVLRQTYADLRLHVVGDGCTVEVQKAVGSIADPRLHFHNLPKAKGYGYANRNHVLRQSAAPTVAYLTDDDLWFPDHLERALGAWIRASTWWRCARARRSFPTGWRSTSRLRLGAGSAPACCATGSSDRRRSCTGGCVRRGELLEHDLTRFGDREFYNRIRRSAARTAFVDEITVMRFTLCTGTAVLRARRATAKRLSRHPRRSGMASPRAQHCRSAAPHPGSAAKAVARLSALRHEIGPEAGALLVSAAEASGVAIGAIA
jgi:glycosyltransferase involved in cell wall biosynthesis